MRKGPICQLSRYCSSFTPRIRRKSFLDVSDSVDAIGIITRYTRDACTLYQRVDQQTFTVPVIAMLTCYRARTLVAPGPSGELRQTIGRCGREWSPAPGAIRGCCGSARRGADAEPDVNERHVARDGMAVPSFSNSSKTSRTTAQPTSNNRADTATIGTSVAPGADAGGVAFRDRQRVHTHLRRVNIGGSEGPN